MVKNKTNNDEHTVLSPSCGTSKLLLSNEIEDFFVTDPGHKIITQIKQSNEANQKKLRENRKQLQ